MQWVLACGNSTSHKMAFVGFIRAKCDGVPTNHIGRHLWIRVRSQELLKTDSELQARVGWLLEIEIDCNSSQGSS